MKKACWGKEILRFALLAAMLPVAGRSQDTNLVIEWEHSFGGSSYDTLKAIWQTSEGGYLLGGSSASDSDGNKTSTNYGWYDFWIIRLDSLGNKTWERTFGGSGEDTLQALQQTADGGFIAGGSSISGLDGTKTSENRGLFDFWIVRMNSSGEKIWEQSFGGDGTDVLRQVVPMSDGGFVIGGTSNSGATGNKASSSFGSNDVWVVRIDSGGGKIWDRSYGGAADDVLGTICLAPDGGLIVGAYSASGIGGNKTNANFGNSDFWILKLDASGNKLWERTFGGTAADRLFDVAIASNGFVLAGESSSTISGNKTSTNFGLTDFWLVRLDTSGGKLWDRSFGGFSSDRAWSARQTPDAGLIVGGRSSSDTSGNKTSPAFGAADFWIIRSDANGGKLWERAFGGEDHDELFCLQPTLDGGYILGGESRSTGGMKTAPNFGLDDIWILKLSRGPYLLALEVNSPERGAISAAPLPGANGKYTNGTLVTLTAVARTGYRFRSWGGDVSGTNTSAQVLMDNDKRARADFMSTAPPVLSCSALSLTNFVGRADAASSEQFSVWNSGGSTLNYGFTSNVPWLVLTPRTGTIVDETNTHTVTFVSSNLAVGSHRGTITATNEIGGTQYTITVILAVLPGPTNVWQKEFGGRDDDVLSTMISTRDGGFLLGGSSMSRTGGNKGSQNFGSNDFWIIRLDASGTLLWDASFGGRNDDDLWAAAQTLDGGFVVGGGSMSGADGNKTTANFGGNDFWVVRVDSNGNKVWDRSFGGNGNDTLSCLEQLQDGGFLLGGQSSSIPSGNKTSARFGNSDFWIVRLDASGNKLWDRSFGGTGVDELKALTILSDGGFVLAGQSASPAGGSKTSPNFGSTDFWLMRLDSTGTQLWDRSFGGVDTEILWALEKTSGGFLLGGDSASASNGNKRSPQFGQGDCWVVCVDGSGGLRWEQSLGGQGYETLTAIRQSGDGGFIVAAGSESGRDGNKTSANFGGMDFWLLRLDPAGTRLWDISLGTAGHDECAGLLMLADGTCVLGGTSDSGVDGTKTTSNFGGFDFWTVKVAPDWIRLRAATPSQQQADAYRFLLFGPTNFVYVTEVSTNVKAWQPVRSNLVATSPAELTDLSGTNSMRRFYRTRLLP